MVNKHFLKETVLMCVCKIRQEEMSDIYFLQPVFFFAFPDEAVYFHMYVFIDFLPSTMNV